MQDDKSLLHSLRQLDIYEALGKEYYTTFGEKLTHAQYLYLQTLPREEISLRKLQTPKAVHVQEKLALQFKSLYREHGLTEEDFFRKDLDIEVEKLLRYTHFPAHKHFFIECSYVFSGRCIHIINGCEYINEAGTFTVIPPGVQHELIAEEECLCLTVKIRQTTFHQLHIPNLPSFVYPLSFSCSEDSFILQTLLHIYEQQLRKSVYYTQIIQDLFQVLLTYVMQNYRDTMQIMFSEFSNDATMIEILNYMYENYQNITLHALAKHFHFNDAYLSNRIHKEFDKPFTKILREFKLHQAAGLLQTTDLKLEDICNEIGYKDSRQFIRNFKEQYNITPAKYRNSSNHRLELFYFCYTNTLFVILCNSLSIAKIVSSSV